MREEIFGPVVTIYLYDPEKYDETVDLIDKTAIYGLTGSLFARDRDVIVKTSHRLRHAAGNYYINDKPTGAVVGRQPFGGARGSGTNDKAGGAINLYRWLSPRTIKECFLPPTDFTYPFMNEE
jgi:1-pyrroline-5-carboxylate dehydrogenase